MPFELAGWLAGKANCLAGLPDGYGGGFSQVGNYDGWRNSAGLFVCQIGESLFGGNEETSCTRYPFNIVLVLLVLDLCRSSDGVV